MKELANDLPKTFIASAAEPSAPTPAPPAAEVAAPVEPEEEEPEDHKPAIEAACAETAECKPVKNRLDACTDRVNANPDKGEDCVEVSGVITV